MRAATFDHITGTVRPLWRGKVHAAAAVIYPLAAAYLVSVCKTVVTIAGSLVYATGMLLCFGISAMYHTLCKSPKTQKIFRRLDHSSIYFLIAGTYTPVCLIVLSGPYLWLTLGSVWTIALAGVYMKMRAQAFKVSTALYLVLGWSSLVMLPRLYEAAGWLPLTLLFLGGVTYTLGAALFRMRVPALKKDVFGYHEVWHLMTLIASGLHYAAVYIISAGMV